MIRKSERGKKKKMLQRSKIRQWNQETKRKQEREIMIPVERENEERK